MRKVLSCGAAVTQKSAFVIFPDVHSACAAAAALRNETHVDAVELFDRASLRRACNPLRPFHPPFAIWGLLRTAKKVDRTCDFA